MAPTYRRGEGVLADTVDDKAVLVDPSGSEVITLNVVGTLVWEELAAPADLETLTARIAPRFTGVDSDRVGADISAFLDELERLGLVESSS